MLVRIIINFPFCANQPTYFIENIFPLIIVDMVVFIYL